MLFSKVASGVNDDASLILQGVLPNTVKLTEFPMRLADDLLYH